MSRGDPATAEPGGGDLDLLTRIAGGDRRAFERFYTRYLPKVSRFVGRLSRRPDVAEEAVSDTMVIVWQTAGRFRGESRVSTWVLGIAYRAALKRLRSDSPRQHEVELVERTLPAQAGEAETAVARAQERRRVRAALGKLTAEHRAVVELTFYEDRSYREIAEIVGCPENTVKTRMFHARRRLKRLLREPDIGLVRPGGRDD